MYKWIAIIALVASPAFADPPSSQPGSQPSSQPHTHSHDHGGKAHDHAHGKDHDHGHAQGKAGMHRGAAFTLGADKEISFDTVAASPKQYASKTVRVKGKISKVCQAKGCWMAIKTADGKQSARITFKDYAFFVPKDVAGRECSVEGVVELKALSEAARAHFAKDEGTTIDKVPEVELRMVATGVDIL
ncbi:MAG: DUF4920 domain-containing protein [Bradymonadia bacterium]